MSKIPRCLAVITLVLFSASSLQAATGPLDLIPENAGAAFAIRNLKNLREKGNTFLEQSGMKVWIRPSEAFQQVYDFLELKNTVDEDAAAAIIVADPKIVDYVLDLNTLQDLILVAIPFKNIDEIGKNFGIEKGKLKPETIQALGGAGHVRFGFVRGKHIYLAHAAKALESVIKAKSASSVLSTERKKALESDDLTLLLGTHIWGKDYEDYLKEIEKQGANLFPPEQAPLVKQMIKTLESLQYLAIGARLEDGLGLRFLAAFPKDLPDEAAAFLKTLKAGPGASDLRGLPTGRVIAAHSAQTDGSINSLLARFAVEQLLRAPQFPNRIFALADKSILSGVFTELWSKLKGRRLAVYQNTDLEKQGMFSIAAILDSDDPKKFLDEIVDLGKLAEGKDLDLSGKNPNDVKTIEKLIIDLGSEDYKTRENASLKLNLIGGPALPYLEKHVKDDDKEVAKRSVSLVSDIKARVDDRQKEALTKDAPKSIHPGFVLARAAETIEGDKIDLVHVKLGNEDVRSVEQMRILLGPDWAKIRMATVGKQVVLLIGSDVALFQATLKNVKDAKPGLAADKGIAAFLKQSDPSRKFELHASLNVIDALTGEQALDATKLKEGASLSSGSFSVDKDRFEVNLYFPMVELKEMIKRRGW